MRGVAALVLLWLPLASLPERPRAAGGVSFTDVTARAKIAFVHQSGASAEKRMVETFGSGVAWIDYDNDGLPDLYFVNGAPGAPNALYRNAGDGTFADVTRSANVSGDDGANRASFKTGVAVGDFDGNGYLDLYVTAFGPNILYRNDGDGTFTDVTAAAGVAGGPDEWSTSTGFFDFDRDGDLDLYVVNYLDYRLDDNPYCGLRREGYRMYCNPTTFDGKADRLYRNDGNGRFTDVSRAAGIANPAGKGLGVVICDYDGDADPDVYVANDMVRNFLYRNNGDGTFVDVAYGAAVGFDANGKPQAGMGVDCGDVDGNGMPDLFVTNFEDELNTLYANRGAGLFEDVTAAAGLGSAFPYLGFGTRLFDADNDGDLDIYVTNGHVIDNVARYRATSSHAQRDLFYENVGGRFEDVTAASGAALRVERVGRGLATADFDNDGDVDVVISTVGGHPVLLRNDRAGGNWLLIRAQGRRGNTFGLGARVRVRTPAGEQAREITSVASYESASDVRLHVGLGAATAVERLEIAWPGGASQVLTDVPANQIVVIKEP